MSIWRLVVREILYRRLSFGLGVLTVAVAVGCLVGQLTLLRHHDLRAEQVLAEKEKETQEHMARLEDDYRKITRNLGFNIRILPKDLNLLNFYAKDYADKYMPEEYALRLAKAKVVTVTHLLPTLQQKIDWPEQELTVILVGTRGEVPILYQEKKKPIQDAVPRGQIVVGYQLHRTLSRARKEELKPGDKLTVLGHEFSVQKLHPKRGDQDDVTLWVHLEEAQKLLDKKGLINGILALGCNCSADRLGLIREEIAGILPDTQVEEFETKATARAEARNRAAAEATAALGREKKHQTVLRAEQEAFAAVLVPLVLLGAMISVAILGLNNVRERRAEIGLFRAVGLRSGQLFTLFVARGLVLGLLGALVGYGAGSLVGAFAEAVPGYDFSAFDGPLLVIVGLAAPVLAAIACLPPAVLAMRQDPALVLQQE
jgi:putative ABC transport system permease protein